MCVITYTNQNYILIILLEYLYSRSMPNIDCANFTCDCGEKALTLSNSEFLQVQM